MWVWDFICRPEESAEIEGVWEQYGEESSYV